MMASAARPVDPEGRAARFIALVEHEEFFGGNGTRANRRMTGWSGECGTIGTRRPRACPIGRSCATSRRRSKSTRSPTWTNTLNSLNGTRRNSALRCIGREMRKSTTRSSTTRPKFLAAGAGMTGANFAVAETGGFVVCTNEGRERRHRRERVAAAHRQHRHRKADSPRRRPGRFSSHAFAKRARLAAHAVHVTLPRPKARWRASRGACGSYAGSALSHPALFHSGEAAGESAITYVPRFLLYNSLNPCGKHRELPADASGAGRERFGCAVATFGCAARSAGHCRDDA
jgi:LUD domain